MPVSKTVARVAAVVLVGVASAVLVAAAVVALFG